MMMMMKPNALWRAMAFAGLGAVALSGCGSDGSDGSNGEDGQPGPVGKPVSSASAVVSTITGASFDDAGILTLNFSLADANGVALYGLKDIDIAGVSLGRIGNEDEIGSTDIEGEPRDVWLSYYTKTKGEFDGETLFAGSGYFSGLSYRGDVNCTDCLTDNNDGTYTLVTKGTKPDGSAYEVAINTNDLYSVKTDVTHGVYMAIKVRNDDASEIHLPNGDYLNTAGFYYWLPSADTVAERPKHVIANETCESCHRPGHDGNLGNMHHPGKHTLMDSCTFCHVEFNEYQTKDDDGNVIGKHDGSIKGIAHEFHSHSFFADDGLYPQNAANCQTCHQADEAVANADAWTADKDTATCLNCHDSQYGVPSWHWDAENSQIGENYQNCVSCHGQGARGAEAAHYDANANARSTELKVSFDSMTVAVDGSSITTIFKIMDGEDMVPLSQIDPRPYKYGGFTSAIVLNGVLGDDFLVNYQKVGFDTFTQLGDGRIQSVISDADFAVKELVDAGATIALSSQIHVCFGSKGKREDCVVDAEGNLDGQEAPYLVSDTFYFQQDGAAVADTPRIQHAEMTACQDCHTTAIKHRYTNDMDGCATCHNGTRDKKGTGSSNLAYIVHSKHYIGGFFKKTDCATCHGDSGFSLSLIPASAAPVAFGTTDGGRFDPATNEQLLVSPQTAACVSCHLPPYGLSDSTVAHIKAMGGVIDHDGDINTIGVPSSSYPAQVEETCSTCHSDSQVLEAHANWSSSH
ncbi:multiheme c-type cytochrome [Ferrimonas futtsuensis]|uniref:multiheme c-type cytochrome n=1 Tax=Ferrimonas futtsuensis TaxID=364764 RepID=UPI0003F94B5C|nr:cytochrome c3 family protein [Ferrimonas futtsuensis]